jgi:hypothetical protein
MRLDFLRSSLAAIMAAVMAVPLAAAPGFAAATLPVIGTVISGGAFRLNHATVRSNATLFEGATVETGVAPSRMDLVNGARLELESESTGRAFGDRLLLDRGGSRIEKATGFAKGFRVEARGLTIQPDNNASTGRIVLAGASRVEVAVLTGSFRVLSPRGLLVARIATGRALVLEPQPAPGPARLTGRLVSRNGHYLLTDETTNVTVEVAGSPLTKPALTKALGQRVEVTGTADPAGTPVSDAAQLIEVAQVTAPPTGTAPAGSGGGTAPAGAGGGAAGGAGGRAASASAVSVTMIAVIGGVAAAAVVGGLAATGSFGGSAAAPVSR